MLKIKTCEFKVGSMPFYADMTVDGNGTFKIIRPGEVTEWPPATMMKMIGTVAADLEAEWQEAAKVLMARRKEHGTPTRSHTIEICHSCYELQGDMCHNAECVFCRKTMEEVGEFLDVLHIRPVIDGERLRL